MSQWGSESSSAQVTIKPRVIKNLYPHNSELLPTNNTNTGIAAPDYQLPNAPAGLKTGSKTSAGTGNCRSFLFVPADSNFWVYSFYAFVPAGVTGATLNADLCGFNGGDSTALTYNWDTPSSSSNLGGFLSNALGNCWSVEDVGNGYKRFSRPFKNNGASTLMILSFGSSVANDKTIISGHMLEQIADDGSSLLPSKYVKTGGVSPFTGQGKSGLGSVSEKRFTFSGVEVYSDSIWGAGNSFKLFSLLGMQFNRTSANVVGGTKLAADGFGGSPQTSVLTRFAANLSANDHSKSLVIFNGGRNDGIQTQAQIDALTVSLRAAINTLGHTNYLVMGVLAMYASTYTGLPGTQETNDVNVVMYNTVKLFNASWAAAFPGKFFDAHEYLVNSYDPLQAGDVAAYALDMRPPSLTGTASTDNLHPNDAENAVIMTGLVDFIKLNY
jgi:hypothetical protein